MWFCSKWSVWKSCEIKEEGQEIAVMVQVDGTGFCYWISHLCSWLCPVDSSIRHLYSRICRACTKFLHLGNELVTFAIKLSVFVLEFEHRCSKCNCCKQCFISSLQLLLEHSQLCHAISDRCGHSWTSQLTWQTAGNTNISYLLLSYWHPPGRKWFTLW